MARRSNRQKIKDHNNRIIKDLRNGQEHLFEMNNLAAGGSEYIGDHTPFLIGMLETVIEIFVKFGKEL